MSPTANLGSATNHLCKPYLLQIKISSKEKGMLKIHESILHAFSMLHSSIFFKYIRVASSWEVEIQFNMGYLDFRFRAQEVE